MTLAPNMTCMTTVDERPTLVRLTHHALYTTFWECETPNGERLLIDETKLMPTTPYRYAENKFARYAAAIGAALRSYPEAVEVNSGRVSPDTFVAHYREAITAKQRYGYKHNLIDEQLFADHADDIRHARVVGTRVLIGPTEALKRGKQTATGTVSASPEVTTEIEFRGPLTKLEQLCEQISNKWFEPPVTFFVRNLDPQTMESLNNRYDIMIVPDASDATKFLIL